MLPERITIIGSGASGIEAARFCAENGAAVFLSDTAGFDVVESRITTAGLDNLINFEGNAHSQRIYDTDLVIVSPGVPATSPVFLECEKRGIKIIGEVEMGYRESVADFIAVTGSAGKSTTVSLIHSVLEFAEKETALCGNIGTPVVAVAPKLSREGIAVVEVSSFQLETIDTFAPKIAVILNLAPNHLDRHASIEEYYKAKFDIAKNMVGGILILNGNQEELTLFGKDMMEHNRVIFFGKQVDGFESFVEEDDHLVLINHSGSREKYGSLEKLRLSGDHNRLNALVAGAVCQQLNIPVNSFTKGIEEFRGLEHRMEIFKTINGIDFINDSKATTPESMEAALTAFPSHSVLLIAGGKDKGGDFELIKELVSDKVKKVILIGSATKKIKKAWEGSLEIISASNLKEAVSLAYQNAVQDNTILLSPGCASFDQFTNFADRGNQFKSFVEEMLNA